MNIIDFSYKENENCNVFLKENNKKHYIEIVNICQVLSILDKTHIGEISEIIDPELEIIVQDLLENTFDSYVFVHKLNIEINKINPPIDNIKSTILNCFNNKIKKMVDFNTIVEGNEYVKYLPFKIKKDIYKISKKEIKISTSKNGTHFYDIKEFSNNNKYIIQGDDSYEAEYIYWTLKDDYKIEDVINLTDNSKIFHDYKRFNSKKDLYPNFKYINIDKLQNLLSYFKLYKIKNYDINYYYDLIDNLDNKMFQFNTTIELTGNKYILVLNKIINMINYSDNKKKYIEMFLTHFHIIDKNNLMINTYINFLNTIQKVYPNYKKEIDLYKFNFLSKYQILLNSITITKEKKLKQQKEILIEMENCEFKDGDIINGIKNFCNSIEINFDMWNSIVKHKTNLDSFYSQEIINNFKNLLYNNGNDFDFDSEDISNSILSLCSLSFDIFRVMVNNNKWKNNNIFMELILVKLQEFNDFYISNLDSFNIATIPRITTIVSSYNTLISRYNFDNKKIKNEILLDNFFNDLKILYEKDATIQYEGAAIKVAEDISQLQLMANYYDYKLNIHELFLNLYYKLNNITAFFYDYMYTLYNIIEKPESGQFVTLCEQAESIMGACSIVDKNIISLSNKQTNATNRNHIFIKSFNSYLGIFKSMNDTIFQSQNSDKYTIEITKSIMDWKLIY